jgi:hypothetical protein
LEKYLTAEYFCIKEVQMEPMKKKKENKRTKQDLREESVGEVLKVMSPKKATV